MRALTKCDHCDGVGNPIDKSTGNKWADEVDYAGPGELSFVRIYNSQGTFAPRTLPNPVNPIGAAWVHNFDRRLYTYVGTATTLASVVRPDGTTRYFRLQADGSWLARTDDPDRLTGSAAMGWTYTNTRDEIESYDGNGKLTSIRLKSGMTLTMAYSDSSTPTSVAPYAGLLITVVDAFAHTLAFTYNADGRIVTMTAPDGGTFQYEYDGTSGNCTRAFGCGNLTAVTYPDGKKRTYVYNESANTSSLNIPNALTGIIDENNARYATYKYDSSAQGLSTEHAGGTQKYSLNSVGSSFTYITDPLGLMDTYSFTTVAGVRRISQRSHPCTGCIPASATATYTYDSLGNLASETDFNGNRTCYANDTSRNLVTGKLEGAASGANCTTLLAASTLASPMRKTSTDWNTTYRQAKRVAEPLRITTYSFHGDAGVSCAPTGASVGLVCRRSI